MKLCKSCSTEKPEAEFPKDRSKPDGLNAYCKVCARARTKSQLMRPPRKTPPEGLKWCGLCKQNLPLDQFHASTRTYDGLSRSCKACAHANHSRWRIKNKPYTNTKQRERRANDPKRYSEYARRHAYGLVPGEYDRMLAEQEGRCAICLTDTPGGPHNVFAVDHCHDTGTVRGLLCTSCNNGLGRFKHRSDYLRAAAEYIDRSILSPEGSSV